MKNLTWPFVAAASTFALLSVVQGVVNPPLLIGERIAAGGGWVQIGLAAWLAGWLVMKMLPRPTRGAWRRRIWLIFSGIFFTQLLLGIFADTFFLMSGKLHFPIPALIPTGAVYRWELSFMPVFFLATIVLSGPAWCSQLCYFGAFDSLAAGSTGKRESISAPLRTRLRFTVLTLFIATAICLRMAAVPVLAATLAAGTAGAIGLLIIGLSRKRRIMAHCSAYCPAGTLVSILKHLSPWRFRINGECTQCMACTRHCRYDALQPSDIRKGKPARHCTACGDCLSACRHNALEYRFARLSPVLSEKLWVTANIILFTCFLMLARI